MRVPRAGGEEGGGPRRDREDPSRWNPSVGTSHPLGHPSVHSLGSVQGRGSPLPIPALRHPGEAQGPTLPSPGATSLKVLSPGLPAHRGQLDRAGSTEGRGAIALFILEEKAGGGKGPPFALCPALRPSSALSSWFGLSLQMCFQRGHLYPVPAQVPRQPSQPRSSAATHDLGVQHTRVKRGSCMSVISGPGLGPVCPELWGSQQSAPASPAAPTHTSSPRPPACCGVLLYGSFLVLSLCLGHGMGGPSKCRARHLSFPKGLLGPPSCSICVQRAKCPPLPAKKESPRQ